MAVMITGNDLREAIQSGTLIEDANPHSVEGIKYDFCLSNRILKACFGRPIDASSLQQSELLKLVVEPNEVVFVMSKERLILPPNIIAQLSPKRKLSQAGILTLGGLTIDPGYKGRLLIGFLNISSTPFNLIPGKKIIGATFLRLAEDEMRNVETCQESLDDFPDELIEVMQKYRPEGTKAVKDCIQKIREEIQAIRSELKEHDNWRERLQKHDDQIGKISDLLDRERTERATGQDRLTEMIGKINRTFSFIKGIAFLLYAIVTGLVVYFAPKLFDAATNMFRG